MAIAYFDSGTTNTRLYILNEKHEIIETEKRSIGSKDVAISGERNILISAMREMLENAFENTGCGGDDISGIYASGMVTSPFGIKEIPHVEIPVRVEEFADKIYPYRECDFFNRVINLIPGIKTREKEAELRNNARGEEIEAIGVMSQWDIWKNEAAALVFPGSHTHTIYIKNGYIAGILSNFTGEIFHAFRTGTILASILNNGTDDLNEMVAEGAKCVEKYGFNRAMYIAHGMNIFNEGSEIDRISFCEGVINSGMKKSIEFYCKNKWKGCSTLAVVGDERTYRIYKLLFAESRIVNNLTYIKNDKVTPYTVKGLVKLLETKEAAG